MPTAPKRHSREVVDAIWSFNPVGNGTYEQLTAASVRELALAQRRTNELLEAILSNLLMLGADGLHQVIRHHRRLVRDANAKQRAARRVARQIEELGRERHATATK